MLAQQMLLSEIFENMYFWIELVLAAKFRAEF